jgi:hypothetical protein
LPIGVHESANALSLRKIHANVVRNPRVAQRMPQTGAAKNGSTEAKMSPNPSK